MSSLIQVSLRASWCLAVALIPLSMPSRSLARMWKDGTGQFSVEADLVKVADGAVHLRKADGQVLVVPLERLSAADQKYLTSQTTSNKEDVKPEAEQPGDKPDKPASAAKRPSPPKTGAATRTANARGLTEKVLDGRVNYKFGETPLSDAVENLATQAGCPVFFDMRGIQGAGHSTDAPVSAQGKNECLADALGKILAPQKLAFVLRSDYLLVTASEEAEAMLETRVYQFVKPVPNPEQLLSQIQGRIAPTTWDAVGGPGSMAPFPPAALSVAQTQAVHRSLLKQYGEVLRLPVERAGVGAKARAAAAKGLSVTVSLELVNVPLADALAKLEAQTKVRMRIDEKKLNDSGIEAKHPLTRNLKGIKAESALELILSDLHLTWIPDRDGLVITTPEVAEGKLTEVRYDVRDLLMASRGNVDSLVTVITSTVRPTSWDSVGGPGSIQPLALGGLQIKQTYHVHREIENLLAGLHAAK